LEGETLLSQGLQESEVLSLLLQTLQQAHFPAPLHQNLTRERARLHQHLRAWVERLGRGAFSATLWTRWEAAQAGQSAASLPESVRGRLANPREAVDLLLGQSETWFALLCLYALRALPAEMFAHYVNPLKVEALLQVCRHSTDDGLREGAHLFSPPSQTPSPALGSRQGQRMLSTVEKMLFLQNVIFFENLRLDQLRTLARSSTELMVNTGEVLLHCGEKGDSLYIIVEGMIDIINPMTAEVLARRTPGDVIGEISLFDGGERSADAVAVEPTLVLVMTRQHLGEAIADDPSMALEMLRALANFLRTRYQPTTSAALNVQEMTENLSENLSPESETAYDPTQSLANDQPTIFSPRRS
jgi:CRP-like cAMP-binding protein